MRNVFILLIVYIITISCNNSYNINGTVDNKSMNGETIYLYDQNNEWPERKIVDSTILVNGEFSFTGPLDSLSILLIRMGSTGYMANILAESRTVKVELSSPVIRAHAQYSSSTVSSKGLNGALSEMQKKIIKIVKRKLKAIDDNDFKSYNIQDSLKIVLLKNTLKINHDNFLGVHCLYEILVLNRKSMSLKQADSLINATSLAKNYTPIIWCYDNIKAINSTKSNNKFVDFDCKNINGTAAKLSDYVGKGKYVLANFWASWYEPCAIEIPNLKYLHKTYSNLVVLGINVWDDDKKFRKYIKEKGTKWPMLYDSDNNNSVKFYGITDIPTIILFDPQGIIVDRTNLRGENMKKVIADIFKKRSE